MHSAKLVIGEVESKRRVMLAHFFDNAFVSLVNLTILHSHGQAMSFIREVPARCISGLPWIACFLNPVHFARR